MRSFRAERKPRPIARGRCSMGKFFLPTLVLSVLLGVFPLQGCGNVTSSESKPSPPPPLTPNMALSPTKTPEPASQAPAAGPAAEEEPPVRFAFYDPSGRPDPFQPFLLTESQKQNQKFLPPLQRSDINELKLIGVVWGTMGRKAMLQTPDGKGYTVRVGTKVGPNNGVIKRITAQEVVVEERYRDLFGREQTRVAVLKLRPDGEEQR